VLVIVFFVTSSDSGSLVIDTITAGGKVDAPVPQRVFWCSFEGLVAIALLLGGGLGALQAMAVSTGLPFTVVLLLASHDENTEGPPKWRPFHSPAPTPPDRHARGRRMPFQAGPTYRPRSRPVPGKGLRGLQRLTAPSERDAFAPQRGCLQTPVIFPEAGLPDTGQMHPSRRSSIAAIIG
jgi:hypothetical protein